MVSTGTRGTRPSPSDIQLARMSPAEIRTRRLSRTITEADVDRWVAIAAKAVLKTMKLDEVDS